MRFSTVALLSVVFGASTTLAWVPASTTTRSFASNLAPLHSTLEKTHEDVALSPEYAAALDQANAKLRASIPEKYQGTMLPLLTHFCSEYMAAHAAAHAAGKTEGTDPKSAAARFLTGIQYGLTFGMPQSPNHYKFDVTHTALRGREPGNDVDYYKFGCEFFHHCMDLTSPEVNVLGLENLQKAADQLAAGENVIFLANHQSEADPQVTSSCLELAGFGQMAADMVYVAGHKVTTDPLAIPFSMGRNLICIHSKKHINADPDTKNAKSKQNLMAMNALLAKLKQGGTCIWVAPSGGRDRRNVETGEVPLAPFDSKTIDMFRLMGNKAKTPTHYYTFAMVSYDLCPPPDFVEAAVGETRNVRFVPVGVAVGRELESVGGLEQRQTFCKHAMEQCQEDYEKLMVSLSQAAKAKMKES